MTENEPAFPNPLVEERDIGELKFEMYANLGMAAISYSTALFCFWESGYQTAEGDTGKALAGVGLAALMTLVGAVKQQRYKELKPAIRENIAYWQRDNEQW